VFVEDNNHKLNNIDITHDIISSKLSKLRINKAPGVDGLVHELYVIYLDFQKAFDKIPHKR